MSASSRQNRTLAAAVLVALALAPSCGGRSMVEDPDTVEPGAGTSGAGGSGTGGDMGTTGSGATGGADIVGTGGTGTGGSISSGGSNDVAGSTSMGGVSTGGSSTGGSDTDPGDTSGGTAGASTSPDPNCYSPNAKNGAACTQPCTVPCGLGDIGTRTCKCVAGSYSGCTCPRPLEYEGAATAPYCAVGDGSIYLIKNTECTVEWAECIGTDAVEGEIPRGCACMKNPLNSDTLTWFCGSTSRWFRLE